MLRSMCDIYKPNLMLGFVSGIVYKAEAVVNGI
nr:MAG TPA: hypothetical protein [Caudoviricetes sp.]